MGQLPVYYNQEPGWHGGTYAGAGTPSAPLYPFGYGLSYTKFDYSNLRLSPKISINGKVQVSVNVQNAGSRAGDEVVQMYIHYPVASVVGPIKDLKGFSRVTLAPGEKKTVMLDLSADALAFRPAR